MRHIWRLSCAAAVMLAATTLSPQAIAAPAADRHPIVGSANPAQGAEAHELIPMKPELQRRYAGFGGPCRYLPPRSRSPMTWVGPFQGSQGDPPQPGGLTAT
jgi:hypothetical protein